VTGAHDDAVAAAWRPLQLLKPVSFTPYVAYRLALCS